MFGPYDELYYILENDLESLQSELNYASNRKNSFIDLLSYNKLIPEILAADLENLESSSAEFAPEQAQKYISESEPVQLLLDDFPDCNTYQKPFHASDAQYRTYITTLNKKYTSDHIGTVSAEVRRKKIERYLEKKKKRTWKKKIHYDCRKKVADNRLRIKGRFVTRTKTTNTLNEQETPPAETKIN